MEVVNYDWCGLVLVLLNDDEKVWDEIYVDVLALVQVSVENYAEHFITEKSSKRFYLTPNTPVVVIMHYEVQKDVLKIVPIFNLLGLCKDD